jgi:hypothetical protein
MNHSVLFKSDSTAEPLVYTKLKVALGSCFATTAEENCSIAAMV